LSAYEANEAFLKQVVCIMHFSFEVLFMVIKSLLHSTYFSEAHT